MKPLPFTCYFYLYINTKKDIHGFYIILQRNYNTYEACLEKGDNQNDNINHIYFPIKSDPVLCSWF